MISKAAAIRICTEHFPVGPEQLAAHLKVSVSRALLQGVEGWCVRGIHTIIRVNSSSSPFRQRFTLAHELAHLVLGTEPDIAREPFRSDSQEEREADQLASEFLIPKRELHRYLRGHLPVDATTLKRLAKAANVSPVMAACRVVSATEDLGLQNSAVVYFVNAKEIWRYSQGVRFDEREAERLLRQALATQPKPVRDQNPDGNVVVGSLIDAQTYQVLLIQLLTKETATLETREERRQGLATEVFADDYKFRQSVAGSLSAVKRKCQGRTLEEAAKFFEDEYLGAKYTGSREQKLKSAAGREFVRICLESWFS